MIEKTVKILHTIFALCLLFFIGNITYELFAQDFNALLLKFLDVIYKHSHYERLVQSSSAYTVFIALRVLSSVFLFFLGWHFMIFINGRPYILYGREKNQIKGAANVIFSQYTYLQAQGIPVLIGLVVLLSSQLILFGYLLLANPYHYDEAWTYTYFSGKSVISSFTFYPAPNNHVFHNIVSSIFLLLPFDEITGMRLPAYLGGLLSTFYFFKLIRLFTPAVSSLICTTLFTYSFPFMYYSVQARGYGLLILFSVLSIYSFAGIVHRKDQKKYMLLYGASSILGFFTIPSFLYCFVVINLILFIYFLSEKKKGGISIFIKTNLAILIFTLILYAPIIGLNGWGSLTSNNGVIERELVYLTENYNAHLRSTWTFLSGIPTAPLALVIPLFLIFIINLFSRNKAAFFFSLLGITFLISPLLIIFIHKVIPFERTWTYMVIPVMLGVGMILHGIILLIRKLIKNEETSRYKTTAAGLATGFVVFWAVFQTARTKLKHENDNHMDYVVARYIQLLEDKIKSHRSIGYLSEGLNFYLAEDIRFESLRRDGEQSAPLHAIEKGKSPEQDIVVWTKNDAFNFMNDYKVLPYDNPFFTVYLKKNPCASH